MNELLPCLCGKTPEKLEITDAGKGGEWANVSGNCCCTWMVEFRINYHDLNSNECMSLAIKAWNKALRWDDETI